MSKSPVFSGRSPVLLCPRCMLYFGGLGSPRVLRKNRRCRVCGLGIAFNGDFIFPGWICMYKDGTWFRYKTADDHHDWMVKTLITFDQILWSRLQERSQWFLLKADEIDDFFYIDPQEREKMGNKWFQKKRKERVKGYTST